MFESILRVNYWNSTIIREGKTNHSVVSNDISQIFKVFSELYSSVSQNNTKQITINNKELIYYPYNQLFWPLTQHT